MAERDPKTLIDGSVDFAGGVNSYVTPTIQSNQNPNGLARNQVSWMDNATVRGGGITQRPAWLKNGNFPDQAIGLYQGSFMYEPDSEDPYLISAVGGHIWKLDVSNPGGGIDLSAMFGLVMPSTLDRYFFCQAEQFLVIQAGDYSTLPLFWDGASLRRSLGLTGLGIPTAPKIPGVTYGHFGFTAGGFTVPAAIGLTVVIPCADTSHVGAVGTDLFFLNGSQYFPPYGDLLAYWTYISGWRIVNVVPNVSVELQLLGYSPGAGPGTIYGPGFSFFTLFTEPTQFSPGTPELPAAGPMDYFMGRLWYAQGRQYSAGDIVGGTSGTLPYAFRDSVLKVTENPLAIGGDGFTVPTNSGNIRAIKHSANINTQLGQGQLYIFTRRSVYSMTVPVSRLDWTLAGNIASSTAGAANQMPLQTVVQITNGAVNDRSVTAQNGDLFFQSLEPAVRSLITAIRYYDQWGNVPISINEDRILRFNDRGLMQFASGISFDNRVLQTVLPVVTPVGVAHKAIMPLNFDVISTLERKLPPVWEGMYEGLDFLELTTGDFGGRPRAFAPIWSEAERHIQLWEITTAERFDNPDNRVVWYVEFPAFTWGDEFSMKKLVSGEIWLDRIFGEVMFELSYRVDSDPCWYTWNKWKECTARNSCEDVHNPVCLYPREFCESYRQTVTMPKPPDDCNSIMGRPSYIGFQFQPRLAIKGFCRIRGVLLKAEKVDQEMYSDLRCT